MSALNDLDKLLAAKSPASGNKDFLENALRQEGVSGHLADIARSIYQQESGGGKNTTTSTSGARGGMQIMPGTFNGVADAGWNIDDPDHNARAGVRYLKDLYGKAEGDARLTAVGYYGGEGGMNKARSGVAVSDPRNPNAPNTLQYAQQVLNRMGGGSDGSQNRSIATDDANEAYQQSILSAALGVAAAKPKAQRGIGGVITDTAKSLAGGVNGLVNGAGELYGLVTGDMDNAASRLGKRGQEYWEDEQSGYLKGLKQERTEKIKAADSELGKFGTAAWETISSPSLLLDTVSSNATTFLPGALVGKAAHGIKLARSIAAATEAGEISAKAASTIAKAKNAAQGLEAAVTAGEISPALAQSISSKAANFAVAGAKTGGAIQQAADVSGTRYDDDMKKTDAELMANPEYVSLKAQLGGTPAAGKEAQHRLALQAARASFMPAAGISYAANSIVPGGETAERAILGLAQRNASRGLVKGLARDIAGETTTEILEEGGGRLAANIMSRRYVDPNQNIGDGVGESAGMGAAGGFGFGLVGGIKHRISAKPHLQAETGALTAAANAGQQATADRANASQQDGSIDFTPAGAQTVPKHELSLEPLTNRDPNSIDFEPSQANINTAGLDNLQRYSTMGNGYPLPELRVAIAQRNANGENLVIIPHADGGYTVAPSNKLSESVKNSVRQLQPTVDDLNNELLHPDEVSHRQSLAEARRNMAAPTGISGLSLFEEQRNQAEQLRIKAEEEQAAKNQLDFEQQLRQVDERTRASDHQRALEARNAIRDEILANESIPDNAKKAAFASALAQAGYVNSALHEDDNAAIDSAIAAKQTIHTPNEMPVENLINEKTESAPAEIKNDFPKVEQAIAKGYRLKGRTLVSPTGKPFRLNSAELEFYKKQVSQEKVAPQSTLTQIDRNAHESATSPINELEQPTTAQKQAGNYKKGHISFHGLNISIENPEGSTRSGTSDDGKAWETTMQHHYGYIKGTVGADNDHIDTFIGKSHDSRNVFIVDQVNPKTGKFDEHKIMLGFNTKDEARAAYESNYEPGWQGGKNISETTIDGLKQWLSGENTSAQYAPEEASAVTLSATSNLNTKDVNEPVVQDSEAGKDAKPFSPVLVRISSQNEFIEALRTGNIVELPNKQHVKLIETKEHGWNFAYNYPGMRQVWAQGALPVIPGHTLYRTKEGAILAATEEFSEQIDKSKTLESIDPDIDDKAPQWATTGDIVTKNTDTSGWEPRGKNVEGNEVFEKDGRRRVIEGEYSVEEASEKDTVKRYAELKTLSELGRKPAITESETSNTANNTHDGELTTLQLNRLSIKQMTDDQLRRAATELPKRALPIAREMKRRGIEIANKVEESGQQPGNENTSNVSEQPKPLDPVQDIESKVERTVVVPQFVSDAVSAQLRKQKAKITRLRNEAEQNESLGEKLLAQTRVAAAEAGLRKMRQEIFNAEDAALQALENNDASDFQSHSVLFPEVHKAIEDAISSKTEASGSHEKTEDIHGRPLSEILVTTEFADAETGEIKSSELPASEALTRLDTKILTLKNLIACMRG